VNIVSTVAACARILFLSLLLSASGAALAATNAAQIAKLMHSEFDRPGQPLLVDPVSVEGAFAIAGWSQGGGGGRALLQRTGANWQIVLCAGDALLQPATLIGAGMAQDAATRLVAHVRAAEARLPVARREQFTHFAGVIEVGTSSASVSVTNAWARATPPGVATGAAYFTIVNRAKHSDTLVSLTTPAAAMAELHQTTVENGLSRMHAAGQIAIAPGQAVKADPGGLHVMLMGLKSPLVAGTKVPLVLTFRHAGAVTVQMDVQPATYVAREAHVGH
jgi:periplasmic copper chaperone A